MAKLKASLMAIYMAVVSNSARLGYSGLVIGLAFDQTTTITYMGETQSMEMQLVEHTK